MGSRITIHNNTTSTVLVAVGNDQAATRIAARMALLVFGAIAAACLAFFVDVTWAVGVAGSSVVISAGRLPALFTASNFRQAAGVAATVLEGVRGQVSRQGYTALRPGESYTSEEMRFSLWRQCHVLRMRQVRRPTIIMYRGVSRGESTL